MDDKKDLFNYENREIADEVADEILVVEKEKDRHYLWLILLFLLCLIFLVASLSFAVFNTYYNGGHGNVIDIGTDVIVDDDNNNNTDANNNNKKSIFKSHNNIDSGTVLFSYNEESSSIYMTNVFPTSDEVGKKLSGDREYFDFSVSAKIKNKKKGKLIYEIGLLPLDDSTIDTKDIRVYLTQEGKIVSINSNDVNTFSLLPSSVYHENAKVIYRKAITESEVSNYTFRMWYSSDAKIFKESKKFGCKVVVDAYYSE